MPHAAEVHRLHMHALERLKSHRTGVRLHAVAIARIQSSSLRLLRFRADVSAFSAANSADVLHVCTDRPRSANGAPTALDLSWKDRASGSTAPLPARFDTRPQHGSTRMDCWPRPGTARYHCRFSGATGESENSK